MICAALSGRTSTIETTPFPRIGSNTRHSISGQITLDRFEFRAGINNFTDRGPSSPSTVINYGDIPGRRFFVGGRVKF